MGCSDWDEIFLSPSSTMYLIQAIHLLRKNNSLAVEMSSSGEISPLIYIYIYCSRYTALDLFLPVVFILWPEACQCHSLAMKTVNRFVENIIIQCRNTENPGIYLYVTWISVSGSCALKKRSSHI